MKARVPPRSDLAVLCIGMGCGSSGFRPFHDAFELQEVIGKATAQMPKDFRRQVFFPFPANAENLFFLAFCVGLHERSEDLLSPTGLVSSVRVSGLAFRNDPQGRFGDVYSAVERASRATKLQNLGFAGVYLCKQAKSSRVCEN